MIVWARPYYQLQCDGCLKVVDERRLKEQLLADVETFRRMGCEFNPPLQRILCPECAKDPEAARERQAERVKDICNALYPGE